MEYNSRNITLKTQALILKVTTSIYVAGSIRTPDDISKILQYFICTVYINTQYIRQYKTKPCKNTPYEGVMCLLRIFSVEEYNYNRF